jgi:hypothetical protein
MSNFPTAAEARAGSRNNLAIHDEIRFIEAQIYQAIEDHEFLIRISGSPMTNPLSPNFDDPLVVDPSDYYAAEFSDYSDTVKDRSLREQMDMVAQNFTNLGYQVTRLKNNSSGRTFLWEIIW